MVIVHLINLDKRKAKLYLTRLSILSFLIPFSINLYGQNNKFEIVHYDKNDPFAKKFDCSTLEKFSTKSYLPNLIIASNIIKDLEAKSSFKETNWLLIGKIQLNPNFLTLLFIEKSPPDTINMLEDKKYKLFIYNFNNACELISTACVGKFQRVNPGLSFDGIDTNLSFEGSFIKIKEVLDSHPTDMIVRFKVTENTFKTVSNFALQLTTTGELKQVK